MQMPTRIFLPSSCIGNKNKKNSESVRQGSYNSNKGLCFSTTGEIGEEYIRYHCRPAELVAVKKRDVQYHYFMDSGQGFVCCIEGGTFIPKRFQG